MPFSSVLQKVSFFRFLQDLTDFKIEFRLCLRITLSKGPLKEV